MICFVILCLFVANSLLLSDPVEVGDDPEGDGGNEGGRGDR